MVIGFYGCITGVFILSFNPYLTNTINHQNPFYPLSGNEDVDIMTGNTPQLLKDKNRIESVFISLFSFPTHEEEDNMHIPFAVPSNLSFQKIMDSGKVDTRVGGFGLFFPWILLVSLLLYGLLYFTEKRKDLKYYNYILLLLFFSLFVLPSGWWARYVSFFYAFPLIILLSTLKYSYKKWVKVFHFAIYFMLVANMLISVIITCGTSLYKRNEIDTYLDIFLASEIPVNINFGGNTAFELKMKEAHIKYTEIPTEQADTIILFETLHLQSDQLLSLLKKKK